MPAAFSACVRAGGRVRTISHGKEYFHVCFKPGPGGHSKSVRGEMHHKKSKK
jgi:hypothetical protein